MAKPWQPKNKYPNTTILVHCNACDSKWESEQPPRRCPKCKYRAPAVKTSTTEVLTWTRVNTKDGRIVCHLVKD